MDIIYYEDQHAFENSHDKISLTEFSLEKQFAYFKNKNITTPSLWLDFKNLSERNSTAALNDLTKLLNDYQLSKENIWIESSTYQALSIFKNAGYKTSYYFPYYEFSKMSTEEIDAAKKLTEEILHSQNITAISFYGEYYDFISTLNIPSDIVLLTWLDNKNWKQVLWASDNEKFLLDERIRVILVKDRSKYNR